MVAGVGQVILAGADSALQHAAGFSVHSFCVCVLVFDYRAAGNLDVKACGDC